MNIYSSAHLALPFTTVCYEISESSTEEETPTNAPTKGNVHLSKCLNNNKCNFAAPSNAPTSSPTGTTVCHEISESTSEEEVNTTEKTPTKSRF